MEDDDEFGDLYTDVLRPIAASVQSQPRETDAPSSFHSRSIDRNIDSDDDEILYGASDFKKTLSNSGSGAGTKMNEPIQQEALPRPERGGLDLELDSNLEAPRNSGGTGLESSEARVLEKGEGARLPEKGSGGSNFTGEDDDLNIVVEERENKDDELVLDDVNLTDRQENLYTSSERNENKVHGPVAVDEMGAVETIPGLSGKLGNGGGSNFEDEWESEESEDDLQIVLNDNNHGPMGMERMAGVDDENDEEGDHLVILADNGDVGHHHQHQPTMEEQPWGGEEGGADVERKELGDAAKASGGGGGTAAPVQPKIGYSNHVYNQPFHSQFKYVRPGAAPIPGAAPVTPGGIQGQVRPAIPMGVVAGRGRGDWRPTGIKGAVPMQKGFHSGYGMPSWGANAAGRGFGSGLDFTLPSHKTIFEVDIDGFEEKSWRLPGIDVSDFFNFGLHEESWKDYCKQLEQLRLETTMQSKIRVYESGRAEQDYDPDLPPELAAAAGNQDIPSDNGKPGKGEADPTDLARASARGRPTVPIGRPIPVETGASDRLPSIDTRRPRMHDSDAVIEIVCQSSQDNGDMAEQPDNESSEENVVGEEIDDLPQDDAERNDRLSHAYNGEKREPFARKAHSRNIVSRDDMRRDDDLHFASEVSMGYRADKEIVPHVESDYRSTKGRSHVRSPGLTSSNNNGEKQMVDENNEFDSEDGKQNPPLSSSCAFRSDEEQAVAAGDDANDESVMDDRSIDIEREETSVDATTRDVLEDGILIRPVIKQKVSSRLEQLSQENDDVEDSKATRSSENSKARSGSSNDNRKFHDSFDDEVLQDRHHRRSASVKRTDGDENARRKSHHESDGSGRYHMAIKAKEGPHLPRGGDPNSSLHRHMKSDGAEWRKESDVSEGSWRRRDENLRGRRSRVEDTRKREHSGEIGSRNRGMIRENEKSERDENYQSRNQLDNGSRRRPSHKQDTGSRQRDRADDIKTRNEKVDDLPNTRRKEGANLSRGLAEKEQIPYDPRESSNRRKRGRDDNSDQRGRDDHAELKDGDKHYARHKEEGSLQKERGERQRDPDDRHRHKQSNEEIVSRREREETRSFMRSGRLTQDRTRVNHSRGKDDYKGSGREYHPKDVGRHGDQLKRRDRVENEFFPQVRGNQVSNDEKRTRHERPGTSDERVIYASDTPRLHEHRQEGSRKSKHSESGDQSSLIPSKKNQDEHSGQISETVKSRGRTENDIHVNHQSSRKHENEASSDDEQTDSRSGRSKLERWTSHKEREFATTSTSSSSLKKNKDLAIHNNGKASSVSRIPDEASKQVEATLPQASVDDKATNNETNNNNAKVVDDNKHLDTVEKLKKRSERFKLPMPSEKEAIAIKKMENEPLPSAQTQNRMESEIKPERPARKRRWTGN